MPSEVALKRNKLTYDLIVPYTKFFFYINQYEYWQQNMHWFLLSASLEGILHFWLSLIPSAIMRQCDWFFTLVKATRLFWHLRPFQRYLASQRENLPQKNGNDSNVANDTGEADDRYVNSYAGNEPVRRSVDNVTVSKPMRMKIQLVVARRRSAFIDELFMWQHSKVALCSNTVVNWNVSSTGTGVTIVAPVWQFHVTSYVVIDSSYDDRMIQTQSL